MADLLSLLNQRRQDNWLLGFSSEELGDRVEQARHELEVWQATHPRSTAVIFLAERDPLRFLAAFLVSCSHPTQLFLCNPDWANHDWQQLFEQIQPDLFWGDAERVATWLDWGSPAAELNLATTGPQILIPTGGSSGKLRFASHRWETLMAAVNGFQQYFEVGPIHSLCVLPLYHVSGLMQFLRSLITGGKLAIFPFKALVAGNFPAIDPQEFFLSLVPTQLQKLLDATLLQPGLGYHGAGLNCFKAILLGGAPAWPELLEQSRRLGLPLAPTYGMTETAAQIVTLKPRDFWAGNSSCGQVLPHAAVKILGPMGQMLEPNQTGVIALKAASLMVGYYPPSAIATGEPTALGQDAASLQNAWFYTDDLGYQDANGFLYMVGRQSDKIITGGENVFPAEVEAALRATGLVRDVVVVGLPDRTWGEAIAAVYVPIQPNSASLLQGALEQTLTRFKIPKRWIEVAQLPRNSQGKLNRQQVRWLAAQNSTESANSP